MSRLNRENSEPPYYYRSPGELLAELRIEEPGDIQIEAIAQYCGATVLYEPLEGSEARLIGYRQRALITIDSKASLARQRFSAAHELGHWMWDRGRMAFACAEKQFNSEWSKDNPERRANRYAEELLLPERMFRRILAEEQGEELPLAYVQRLAQRFQTSLTATAIRYVELSFRPAMLICSEHGVRRWYARSGPVPWSYRLKRELSKETLAVSRLGAGENGPSHGIVPAQAWIDLREGAFAPLPDVLHEDSLKISADLVLTLLSW